MSETKYIHLHTTKTKEDFTIHGCGKFGESKKVLSRAEAALLFLQLNEWLSEN